MKINKIINEAVDEVVNELGKETVSTDSKISDEELKSALRGCILTTLKNADGVQPALLAILPALLDRYRLLNY